MSAIDISYWQHYPDFAQVAASGVTLVIMKCADGEGGNVIYDSVYLGNRAAARHVGLRVGSYYFNGNAVSPTQAADDQWGVIDWRAGDIVAIDVEGGSGIVWSVAQTLEWVNRMRSHGVPTGNILVYMSSSLTRQDWSSVIATGVGLWVASYGANDPSNIGPNGAPYVGQWGSYAMWQFSSVSHIPGIIGYVDINVINSSFSSLNSTLITDTPKQIRNPSMFFNRNLAGTIFLVTVFGRTGLSWPEYQLFTRMFANYPTYDTFNDIELAMMDAVITRTRPAIIAPLPPVAPVIDSAALAISIAQHMTTTTPAAPLVDMGALAAAVEAVIVPHFAAIPAAVNSDAATRLAT
jgi:GH25 family lysozyme M1 (1,4-beta-N-acetylmuramidase)